MDTSVISRRSFLASAGLTAAAAGLVPGSLFAQSNSEGGIVGLIRKEAAESRITVQSLRGNVSVLMGSGGNIAVFSGKDGKLLVDAGITASRPRIAEALAAISPAPIRQLINTHWHFDHTVGNAWLYAAGANILAHENTRKHLAFDTRVEGWNFTFPASPVGALPTTVFATECDLYFNNAVILLKHYEPAHTDSDICVHFADADILHVADTWWNGYYPFIDYSTGGSINGTIRATEENLARVTDKTIIIPGHGPVGSRAALKEYRAMLTAVRDNVAALKKQGRSLAEVVAARPTAAYDAKWGGFVINPMPSPRFSTRACDTAATSVFTDRSRTMNKILMGLFLGFLIGVICRYFDIPLPSPTKLIGVLVVLSITLRYVGTDDLLTRPAIATRSTARPATTAQYCGGPIGLLHQQAGVLAENTLPTERDRPVS